MVVLAPSRSPELVRESRRLIRAGDFFDPDGGVRVLGVGELLPLAPARRGTPPAPPLDVARTLDDVLSRAPLDFVHVHEPFAPSTASVALRHSRALNVGTFHAPAERVISTQVARRFVERFFGRLDARTASFDATRELMERAFPATYEVVRAGAETPERAAAGDELRLAFIDHEDRQALRLFLRALRRLPDDVALARHRLHARRRAHQRAAQPPARPRRGRHRGGGDRGAGARRRRRRRRRLGRPGARPGLLVRALGAGAVPVAARLPVYEEVLRDGELGLLFEPADAETLAAQLTRLLTDDALRGRLSRRRRGDRARARLERAWPSASRRSTRASPRAGTRRGATARCARGSRRAS